MRKTVWGTASLVALMLCVFAGLSLANKIECTANSSTDKINTAWTADENNKSKSGELEIFVNGESKYREKDLKPNGSKEIEKPLSKGDKVKAKFTWSDGTSCEIETKAS